MRRQHKYKMVSSYVWVSHKIVKIKMSQLLKCQICPAEGKNVKTQAKDMIVEPF